MSILISVLTFFGYISAIIGIVFLIKLFVIKATYYPSNRRDEIAEKFSRTSRIIGVSMLLTLGSFKLAKETIKYSFKKTVKNNKIISAEINGIFFGQEDMKDVFKNFEPTEGRFRCESFNSYINFDNNETIPIEIIRHCYQKNRYIIISKKYNLDVDIGDIKTSQFDYIQKDSTNSQ